MTNDDQMTFFYEIFDASLPRLGPGDTAQTHRALDTLLALRPDAGPLRVLDVGCGNGAQTLDLARRIDGTVTAVDNHSPYIAEVARRAEVAGLANKIRPQIGDMGDLDFAAGSFDLIWSEGAIYFLGLAEGLQTWRPLLAPGGMMAVTDIVWLQPDPPEECRVFFAEECPFMTDVASNLAAIAEADFEVVDHFVLPISVWREPYYRPLQVRVDDMRRTYAAEPDKLAVLDGIQAEMDIFDKYGEAYGYVFYLVRPRQ